MILRRLDDYQSWQVQHGGGSILIDPWLTPEPIQGAFDRHHGGFTTLAELQREACALSAVLLCTGVNDHLRPSTLRALGGLPMFGPVHAAKAARASGCPPIEAHMPEDVFEVACPAGGCLRVTVTRTGLPLGLLAVGYRIEAFAGERSLGRVWIEPHLPTPAVARACGPVDVVVFPTQSVLALGLPVTAGPRQVAKAAAAARARVLVPTATDPRRDMRGWQRTLYWVSGGTAQIRSLLAGTEVVELLADEKLKVAPE